MAFLFYKVPAASSSWRYRKLKKKNLCVKLDFTLISPHSPNENSLQIRKKYRLCKQITNPKQQQQCRLPLRNHFCFTAVFYPYFASSRSEIILDSFYLHYIDANCIATFSVLLDDPQPKQPALQSSDHNEQKPHHLKYIKKML